MAKTTVQFDKELLDRFDSFLDKLSESGYEVSRNLAFKIALEDFITKYSTEEIRIPTK